MSDEEDDGTWFAWTPQGFSAIGEDDTEPSLEGDEVACDLEGDQSESRVGRAGACEEPPESAWPPASESAEHVVLGCNTHHGFISLGYEPGDDVPNPTRAAIVDVCDEVKSMMLEKNAAYGDSVIRPIGIFSKLSPREGVRARIDDKLKRIQNGSEFVGDNDRLDLIGYLILDLCLDRLEIK